MTDVVVFEDGFTGEVGTVTLDSHTPDVTGTPWTVDAGNSGTLDLRIEGASETHVEASADASTGHYMVYYIAPVLPSADGQIEIDLKQIVNTSGEDADATLLVARRQAGETAYVARIGGNGRIGLYYRTSSTPTATLLDEAYVDFLDGDKFRLRCHGTALTIHHKPFGGAWVQVCEATHGTISTSGGWGIGVGDYLVSGDNTEDFLQYDEVIGTDIQADAGGTGAITQTLVGFGQVVVGDNETASVVIFDDTFTEGSDTLLEAHTPDVGTSWTYDTENTSVLADIEVLSATNYLSADFNDSGDSLMAFANPVATLETANIQMDVVVEVVDSVDDYATFVARRQTDGSALVCFFTDTECWIRTRSTANPNGDNIGGIDWTLVAGETVRFRVFNEVLSVWKKPVGGVFEMVLEASHGNNLLPGQFGFGFGDYGLSGGDISTTWRFSQFTVTEILGSGFNTLMFYDDVTPDASKPLTDNRPDIVGGGYEDDPDSDSSNAIYYAHQANSLIYTTGGSDADVYVGMFAYPHLDLADVMIETQLDDYRQILGPFPSENQLSIFARRQAGGEAYVLELNAITDGPLRAYLYHRATSSGGVRVVTELASFEYSQWEVGDIWRFTLDGDLLSVDFRPSNTKTADGFGGIFQRVMSVVDTTITTGGKIGFGEGEYVTIPGDAGSSSFLNGWHLNYFKYAALAHEEALAVAITATVPIQTILLSLENLDIRCGVLSVIIPGQMGVVSEISSDGPGFLVSIGETGVIS
jgi:hypothetical protein